MLATNAPKQVSSSSSSICLTMTVLPRRRRRDSNNEERELGFHACDWIPIKEPGCLLVVSKRLGSPYVSGRTGHWLKFKNSAALAVKREAEESMAVRFRARKQQSLSRKTSSAISAVERA